MFQKTQVRTLIITEAMAGQRLDNFLFKRFSNIPKSRIYQWIRKGELRINGRRVSAHTKLVAEDKLRIPPLWMTEKPVPKPSQGLCALLKNNILHEDENFIVVNKPAFLAVHGISGDSVGLIEALRTLYNNERLELVHRLDKETSGVLMIAKKHPFLRKLHEAFRNHEVQKIYYALLYGRLKQSQIANQSLVKTRVGEQKERYVRTGKDGLEALTTFHPVAYDANNHCTLVKALPQSGRTHQIRAHAKAIGYPLVGDAKYGSDSVNRSFQAKGLRRLFLHAQAISFTIEEKHYHFSAPFPEDLQLPVFETLFSHPALRKLDHDARLPKF